MKRPAKPAPGRARRALALLCRLALGATLLASAVALHLPAPSGVSGQRQADVRGVWTGFGRLARALGGLLPDVDTELSLDWIGGGDKVIHFALFFALALFWTSARALSRTLGRRSALTIFCVLALYAAVGEAAQALEGRIADVGDWVANVIGAAIGVGAVWIAWRALRRSSKPEPAAPPDAHAELDPDARRPS